MTKKQTKTDQADRPDDDEPESIPLPRYLIDLVGACTHRRSLPMLIAGKRCYQDQQGDEDVVKASDVKPYIRRIRDHCAEMSDYLLPDTPIKEAIFRVMLAGGNKPVNAEDITAVLTEKWAMTAYPRDTSPEVIQRVLEHSGSYCIARIPEPEVEEEPSE
jgi:hypothetical protein